MDDKNSTLARLAEKITISTAGTRNSYLSVTKTDKRLTLQMPHDALPKIDGHLVRGVGSAYLSEGEGTIHLVTGSSLNFCPRTSGHMAFSALLSSPRVSVQPDMIGGYFLIEKYQVVGLEIRLWFRRVRDVHTQDKGHRRRPRSDSRQGNFTFSAPAPEVKVETPKTVTLDQLRQAKETINKFVLDNPGTSVGVSDQDGLLYIQVSI